LSIGSADSPIFKPKLVNNWQNAFVNTEFTMGLRQAERKAIDNQWDATRKFSKVLTSCKRFFS
jgi:hypothetical protein